MKISGSARVTGCQKIHADAKRDEARHKRIAQALEWLAEGKPRNWKHM